MSHRWLVERARESFEDVGAGYLKIEDGCLAFYEYTYDANPTILIAAGHWLTVVREDES